MRVYCGSTSLDFYKKEDKKKYIPGGLQIGDTATTIAAIRDGTTDACLEENFTCLIFSAHRGLIPFPTSPLADASTLKRIEIIWAMNFDLH